MLQPAADQGAGVPMTHDCAVDLIPPPESHDSGIDNQERQEAVGTDDPVHALRAVVEGLEEAAARDLLQRAGGNVQQAVNLYFDQCATSAAESTPSAPSRKRNAGSVQPTPSKRSKGQASITLFFPKATPATSPSPPATSTSPPAMPNDKASEATTSKAGVEKVKQEAAAPQAAGWLMGTKQEAAAVGAPDAVMLPLGQYDPVRR